MADAHSSDTSIANGARPARLGERDGEAKWRSVVDATRAPRGRGEAPPAHHADLFRYFAPVAPSEVRSCLDSSRVTAPPERMRGGLEKRSCQWREYIERL